METERNRSYSSDECAMGPSSPTSSSPTINLETPKRSTSKVRLSKAESAQRKSERDAKRAEEEAIRAEKKRQKEEMKAKRAEELQQEKARRAEEKARKAEELQLERVRKAEELQQEKARRAEERARREAENADKKAEQKQKKEQKQAAAQKQELVHKQMANYMGKFFKPIEKSSTKDSSNGMVNSTNNQKCTLEFDSIVSKQEICFVSTILDDIKSMERSDAEICSHPRLNSDSNSFQPTSCSTTSNSFLIKTRYIHFPEKYFNRPPYYGSFKKALSVQIDPVKPDGSIENVDYTIDSEGEWEEPCKDGEELRSDAEDLSDAESGDSDSDADSFIVPHGHLSDDELNEDEQQQSTSTKQAREAAKSHTWDKKVARRNQQQELKPIFGCCHDSIDDEKSKFEIKNYLSQFRKILVPKEIYPRVEQEEKEKDEENNEESTPKEEKTKRMSKKKSMISKKGLTGESSVPNSPIPTTTTTTGSTAKRTGSASNIVESSSPSKRRKMDSNENCSMIEDSDVLMTEVDAVNVNKNCVLEETMNNFSENKSSPLTLISNDESKIDHPSSCTLLIPKRKAAPV